MTARYSITTNHPTADEATTTPATAGSGLRRAGLICIAGAIVASVGAIVTAAIHTSVSPHRASFPYPPTVGQALQLLWTLANAGVLVGVIGLAWARHPTLVGSSTLGRIGLRTVLLGMTLMVPCELGFVFVQHAADKSNANQALGAAIGVAAVISGIGLTLTGIAALRERSWLGWGRYTPLLCGTFIIVAFIPIQLLRPSIFTWPVAGWYACLALLGSALVGEGARRTRTTTSS